MVGTGILISACTVVLIEHACEGGDVDLPTVRILVDAGEGNQLERWSAARRDITAVLDEHELAG